MRQSSVNALDELRHIVHLLRASGIPAGELTPQATPAVLRCLIDHSAIDVIFSRPLAATLAFPSVNSEALIRPPLELLLVGWIASGSRAVG